MHRMTMAITDNDMISESDVERMADEIREAEDARITEALKGDLEVSIRGRTKVWTPVDELGWFDPDSAKDIIPNAEQRKRSGTLAVNFADTMLLDATVRMGQEVLEEENRFAIRQLKKWLCKKRKLQKKAGRKLIKARRKQK